MAFCVLSFGKKQTREATAVLCSACLLSPFPHLGREGFLFSEGVSSEYPECHSVPSESFWEGDEINEMGNFMESLGFLISKESRLLTFPDR